MDFVFFGTPQFSAIILERLVRAGFAPSLAVTNPDRPAGRRSIITPPPVKVLAEKYHIPVEQPEVLSNLKLKIQNPKFDYAVLASYGKIIPKESIAAFPKGIVVVHPSLLPKYRGATPIQSAILNGDETTGATLILMDEKVDHGPILAKRELRISPPKADPPPAESLPVTFRKLHDELAELSADLLIETLPKYLRGEIGPLPQDESLATYTKKFSTDDAFVPEADLEKAQSSGGDIAIAIDRKIRALNPEPGVWTLRQAQGRPSQAQGRPSQAQGRPSQAQGRPQRVKLLEAEIAGGRLKLKTVQVEGKKPAAA